MAGAVLFLDYVAEYVSMAALRSRPSLQVASTACTALSPKRSLSSGMIGLGNADWPNDQRRGQVNEFVVLVFNWRILSGEHHAAS